MIRVALALLITATPVAAQSVKLQEHEITALLSGNTAVGVWGEAPYRQYFDPDGVTIFAEDGAGEALGEWRVQDGELQALWPGDAEWSGWFVMEYAGDFYWVSKTTPPTPFEVRTGDQRVAE